MSQPVAHEISAFDGSFALVALCPIVMGFSETFHHLRGIFFPRHLNPHGPCWSAGTSPVFAFRTYAECGRDEHIGSALRNGRWSPTALFYFVELRSGYAYSWCQVDRGQAGNNSSPSFPDVRRFDYPSQAEIVGRVTGAAMRIVGEKMAESSEPSGGGPR